MCVEEDDGRMTTVSLSRGGDGKTGKSGEEGESGRWESELGGGVGVNKVRQGVMRLRGSSWTRQRRSQRVILQEYLCPFMFLLFFIRGKVRVTENIYRWVSV